MPEHDMLDSFRADLRARIEELRPLAEELRRLQQAEAALDAADGGPAAKRRAVVTADAARISASAPTPGPDPAPYGYKPDGTPYKRRQHVDPRARALKAAETRRQRAREAAAEPEPDAAADGEAAAAPAAAATPHVLRVLSGTHPTERELQDRRVAWTTEAPALAGSRR